MNENKPNQSLISTYYKKQKTQFDKEDYKFCQEEEKEEDEG